MPETIIEIDDLTNNLSAIQMTEEQALNLTPQQIAEMKSGQKPEFAEFLENAFLKSGEKIS